MRGRKGNSLWKMTGRLPACEARAMLSLPTASVRLSPFSWAETALRFQRRCLTVPALITVKQSHITGDNVEMPRVTRGRGQERPAVSKEVSEACPMLTSWIFCFARLSEGCITVPITFTLPQTTRASSGASVFIPTRPWQTTDSGTGPRCHNASLSFSNCPGLEAWKKYINILQLKLQ